MAYEASYPADNLFIEDVPEAIRVKGADVKELIDTHISDDVSAHSASAIENTPAGNILATNVQGAINELDTKKIPISYIDTSVTLEANSDTKIASQKAVKTFITNMIAGLGSSALAEVASSNRSGYLTIPTSTIDLKITWGVVTHTGDLASGNNHWEFDFTYPFPTECFIAWICEGANSGANTVITSLESYDNTGCTVNSREYTSWLQDAFEINYIAIGY